MQQNELDLLIIEDSPSDAELLRIQLKSIKGTDIRSAFCHSLADARVKLQEKRFSLILLDLSLPDSFGLDTFIQIQKAAPSTPTIILTGGEEDAGTQALQLGAQDYLTKGQIDQQSLSKAILYSISRQRAAESWLASMVHWSEEAIIGMTLDGAMVSWNHAATVLYGYTLDEAIGKRFADLIVDELDRELFDKVFEVVSRGNAVKNHHLKQTTKSGAEIEVAVTCSPIKNQAGVVTSVSTIVRDVSELKKSQEISKQLAVMKDREDFMAALTHDLKNPLIGANRILELFASGTLGALSDSQQDILLKVYDSNRMLLSMVQNLLDVYRYERDVNTLAFAETDLSSLLAESAATVMPLVTNKRLTLEFSVPDTPVIIEADNTALRRVFQNLLDNAIKFTPAGGIIKVDMVESECSIVVRVQDTGPGIAREEKKKLFQRFWQGAAGRHYSPGTGLGLYLCREILKAHNGWIECDSDVGSGCTFTVHLNKSIFANCAQLEHESEITN